MPKGKAYNSKNVGTGGTRTPESVMGNQGKSVDSTVTQDGWHFKNRPTKHTTFEQGTAPRKKKYGRK